MARRIALIVAINASLCLKEILSNKLRSFLTAFGIFLGVSSLIAMLSLIRGMDHDMQERLLKMGGADMLTVEKLDPETPEESRRFASAPPLTLHRALMIKQSVPTIGDIFPQSSDWARDLRSEGKKSRGRMSAVGPGHLEAHGVEVEKGRSFAQGDFQTRTAVCVAGQNVVDELFPGEGEKAVGREIAFRNVRLRIIGITHSESKMDRDGWTVYYPFYIYQNKIGGTNGRVQEMKFRVSDPARVDEAKRAVEESLTALQRGVKNFEVTVNRDKIEEMKTASRVMNAVLFVIAAISLLVGSVNIMNIMFATIGERIREIGVRKALGARKTDLFVQFLTEALLLCLVGALPGMLLGMLPALLPEKSLPFVPILRWWDFAAAVAFALLAGVSCGIFPALRAARMEPVEALRYG